LTQANINREAEAGKRLRDDWQAYLKVRDNVLGLILENSSKEAVELDLSSGVPLFERVRDDLEHVKRLYDQRASERLDVVANSSRQSTFKLIGAFLLTLIFGSLAIWTIHRAQLRREMQLVKMQMEFVTSLSHELRTPIAAILLAGENVRDQVAREPKDLEEQGTIITAQANLDHVSGGVLCGQHGDQWHLPELLVSEVVQRCVLAEPGVLHWCRCAECAVPAERGYAV
jgi:signal transduction histidine kinase